MQSILSVWRCSVGVLGLRFLKMDLLISIASRAMTNGGNTCPLSYRRVRRSNENHHHHQQGWHSYPEVEGVSDADDEVGKNTNL